MFLTRECDYAVRIVRVLSDYEKKPVKEISEIELIPYQFAYKILKKLEYRKLVESFRGIHGGYRLCKPLTEITLLEIVSSVDKGLLINDCLEVGHDCPRDSLSAPCKVRRELCRLQKVLTDGLSEKSMDEILNG